MSHKHNEHVMSRDCMTANRGPSYLVQSLASGSGLGGASPHPTAVGPTGLEPPGTAIGSGWSEDSWGIPVSSDGVCGWLADGYHYPKTLGGQPKLVSASGCDGRLVSSFWGVYGAAWAGLRVMKSPTLRRTTPWATQWGQLDRSWAPLAATALGVTRAGRWPSGSRPDLLTNPDPFFMEGCRWSFRPLGRSGLPVKIVTWLILPVVICLSQRLSHACLSISNLYGETANGSGKFFSRQFLSFGSGL